MKRYEVNATLVGGQYLGEVEAESEDEACNKLANRAGISLCHQCARQISDMEVDEITAEEIEEAQ